MARKLGMEAKLYRNTGNYASPTWSEVANVRDLTMNTEKGSADVTTRGNSGWRAMAGTLKDLSVEFEMVYDTADEDFTAIQTAFMDNDQVEFAVMDGDIAEAGTQGIRATFEVMNFSQSEPLEEAIIVSVTLSAAYADNAPEVYTIAAS
jgi:predicted secreted protein